MIRKRNWEKLFLIFIIIAFGGNILKTENAMTEPSTFVKCVPLDINNTYVFATTIVGKNNNKKEIPIILWKSLEFSPSGFTPEQRCHQVTARLNKAMISFEQNSANLNLTVGLVNHLPVLCYVDSPNFSCESEHVLFTLSQNSRSKPSDLIANMLHLFISRKSSIVHE